MNYSLITIVKKIRNAISGFKENILMHVLIKAAELSKQE